MLCHGFDSRFCLLFFCRFFSVSKCFHSQSLVNVHFLLFSTWSIRSVKLSEVLFFFYSKTDFVSKSHFYLFLVLFLTCERWLILYSVNAFNEYQHKSDMSKMRKIGWWPEAKSISFQFISLDGSFVRSFACPVHSHCNFLCSLLYEIDSMGEIRTSQSNLLSPSQVKCENIKNNKYHINYHGKNSSRKFGSVGGEKEVA